jgi:hypothetical protein
MYGWLYRVTFALGMPAMSAVADGRDRFGRVSAFRISVPKSGQAENSPLQVAAHSGAEAILCSAGLVEQPRRLNLKRQRQLLKDCDRRVAHRAFDVADIRAVDTGTVSILVAQALDYVAALTAMGFEQFEAAVIRGEHAPNRLYDLVAGHPDALGEAASIDAVALNLKRGRMLAMIVGGGIRSETEVLAGLLQSHAGAHFTFALVELATWRTGCGGILAVPNTLARTVMLERGVIRIENGAAVVEPVPQASRAGPQSISMSDFWDGMARRDPSLPQAIRSFLEALEPLGVYPDLKASLNIKADLADRDKPMNFGYITRNGQFWPNPAAWSLPERVWRPYFEGLASLVGGEVIDEPGTKVRGRQRQVGSAN